MFIENDANKAVSNIRTRKKMYITDAFSISLLWKLNAEKLNT